MIYLNHFLNRIIKIGAIIISLFVLNGCTHTNKLGNFRVSPSKLSSSKSKVIAVVLEEPDVRDEYDNGKGYIYTGVLSQLKSAFTKKLQPSFSKVGFFKTVADAKKSDVILAVSFEIKNVAADLKNKCAIDFRVQAFVDGGSKSLSIREDSGFKDLWFSDGRDECRNVMGTLFDGVVDPVLKDIESHFN